eukprot:3836134-Pleurochrysis_carterae.AAC.1
MADTGSAEADNDLRIFKDRFKLTLQERPKQFLGMNIDLRADGVVKISAAAYVKAKAETYLPKPRGIPPLRHHVDTAARQGLRDRSAKGTL